jgi:hypothetical protein
VVAIAAVAAAVVVAVAAAVVVMVAVVDTAGVPAGRLNRNDSDYRMARLEEADGGACDSPVILDGKAK